MKKVVKIRIYDEWENKWYYWICDNFNGYMITMNYVVSLRSSAIRNARQFFKKLGYEVEVEK